MEKSIIVSLIAAIALTGCIDVRPPDKASEMSEPMATLPTPAVPTGWHAENFVAGLSMRVPADASVRRPQGIDSNIIVVRGRDYWLSGDDYGTFNGQGEIRIGGRSATIERRAKGVCRHDVYRIESPRPNRLFNLCPPGQACSNPPGQITLVAQCTTDAGCAVRDAIIGSLRFSPPPWAGHTIDPPPTSDEEADAYNKAGVQLCSVE